MKKTLLLLTLITAFTGFSQIVNIPDQNLKDALLNYQIVIDTNGDGEIQLSEAQFFDYQYGLSLGNKGIADITGLEAFTSITSLIVENNDISAIDFSQFTHIKKLYLGNNDLTSVDLSQNIALETLYLRKNPISQLDLQNNFRLKTLDVSELPLTSLNLYNHDLVSLNTSSTSITSIDISNQLNLEMLDVGYSPINSIDISNHVKLEVLDIGSSPVDNIDVRNLRSLDQLRVEGSALNSLDISQNENLNYISFGSNPLTDIDLSNNINLETISIRGHYDGVLDLSSNTMLRVLYMVYSRYEGPIDLSQNTVLNKIDIYDTNITELDLSNNTELCLVKLKNNALLEYINLQNGANTLLIPNGSCQYSSASAGSSPIPFKVEGSPELEFVCVDDVSYAIENFEIPSTATFIDNCDGDLDAVNHIVGNISYDINNDGCDAADIPIPDVIFQVTDGTTNFGSLSNNEGDYGVNVFQGTYNSQILGLSSYFTVGINPQDIIFNDVDETQVVNYCVIANEEANDVSVTVFPISESRPGFQTFYKIVMTNAGTQTANGKVTLSTDPALLNYQVATQIPSQISPNVITWEYSDLGPFESQTIQAGYLIEQPPTVNGGDILEIAASITPTVNDVTPFDNNFILYDQVVNSFDPNDKKVLQGAEVDIAKKDEYLTYMIRFQNIGSASAINVRLEDALDTSLDWTTLKVVDMSHEGAVTLNNEIDMTINFEGINLPSSDVDEPGSHGYIVYKIKPKKDVIQLGSKIRNTASIFFDFNEAIVTNTVTTVYVEPKEEEEESTTTEEAVAALLSDTIVYPIPSTDIINVRTSIPISHLTVYDMAGRKVIEGSYGATSARISIADLSPGSYLLKITTLQADKTVQILKK